MLKDIVITIIIVGSGAFTIWMDRREKRISTITYWALGAVTAVIAMLINILL